MNLAPILIPPLNRITKNINSFNSINSPDNSLVSIGVDFSFHIIKDIKKEIFSKEAPWYNKPSDGLNWFISCQNKMLSLQEAQDAEIFKRFGRDFKKDCVEEILTQILLEQSE